MRLYYNINDRLRADITKTFHGTGGLGINFGDAWKIEDVDEVSVQNASKCIKMHQKR